MKDPATTVRTVEPTVHWSSQAYWPGSSAAVVAAERESVQTPVDAEAVPTVKVARSVELEDRSARTWASAV